MIDQVKKFIRKKKLLTKRGKYLVALSGGADSVALLCILQELGYKLEACHCNFQLRGEESNRDEEFCVNLCEQRGIPLHRIHFDTKTYAEVHKASIEMAARDLRYQYFLQLKKDIHADGICVAHHQDDNVETILINLIRGAGLKGLTGIAAKNGDIIRPLLCVDRKAILQYLSAKGQDYVTDSTNLIDDVVRNKIRLNVIPMLKEINPAVCRNINNTAHYLEESYKALGDIQDIAESPNLIEGTERITFDTSNFIHVDKDWIEKENSPEYALFTALSPYGFSGGVIEEILESFGKVGKKWESASHVLVIDRKELIVKKKDENKFKPMRLPEPGIYQLPSQSVKFDYDAYFDLGWDPYDDVKEDEIKIKEKDLYLRTEQKIKISQRPKPKDFSPSKEKYKITLDTDKISFPLTLRLAQDGDRFHPFGMKGIKLVSDYLTDKKINLFLKERQLVLVDAKGFIIWLVGERTSEVCKVDDKTSQILDLEIMLEHPHDEVKCKR